MRIYYSGGGGGAGGCGEPEDLIADRKPHIMLTFHELHKRNASTKKRLKRHLKRLRDENK
jgi:hypothetical protein